MILNSISRKIIIEPELFSYELLPFTSAILEDQLINFHRQAIVHTRTNEHLEHIQIEKLRRLFARANEIEFWANRFRQHASCRDGESIKNLFGTLPVLEKRDVQPVPVQKRSSKNLIHSYGVPSLTSGSTGEPLQFALDRRLSCHLSGQLAVMSNKKFSQSHLLSIWPTKNPNPFFGKNTCAIKDVSEFEAQAKYILNHLHNKNTILHIFPSLLRLVLDYLERENCTVQISAILTSGEPLSEDLRSLASSRLNCAVINYYACRELSIIASECRAGQLHVHSEDVLVEVFNEEGRLCQSGEEGRLAFTGLNSHIHPFIRYCNGDYGSVNKSHCTCGSPLPTLSLIGRKSEVAFIELENGHRIQPYNLSGTFNRRFNLIRQYQIQRIEKTVFKVLVICTRKLTTQESEEVQRELNSKLPGAHIRIEEVSSIDSKSGKVLPYVSFI